MHDLECNARYPVPWFVLTSVAKNAHNQVIKGFFLRALSHQMLVAGHTLIDDPQKPVVLTSIFPRLDGSV